MLATLAVDFRQIGVKAGVLAARILRGEDAEAIAVAIPTRSDHVMRISARRLAALGLSLPKSLENCGCVAK